MDNELRDRVRELTVRSSAAPQEAYAYLVNSDNYERDIIIVSRLADSGLSFKHILAMLLALRAYQK